MDDRELMEGLNRDLAEEFGTICRYIQQAALARGPAAHDLRVFLKVQVIDDVFHALFLADTIAQMGGTPTADPVPFRPLRDPAEMIAYDLEIERRAIRHYAERVKQAAADWALGLQARLEKILTDETAHERGFLQLLPKTEGAHGAGVTALRSGGG
ncbi:MAG TPA: ferritin-like domain-containing protein [Candidatus Methylomirabilis sp.]|nr:ferritin-like domain-containing protein [Candidatus Methylomirabilis sp.]